MSESCTIYCKKHLSDYRDFITGLLRIEFRGEEHDAITYQIDGKTIVLSTMAFTEPGDRFCKLLLSTLTCIEDYLKTGDMLVLELENHIKQCDLAIGIVATPSFDSDRTFADIVFGLARAIDGIVFNGTDFLDQNGTLILTIDASKYSA